MSSELEISITDSEEGRAEPCTIPQPVLAIAKSAKKIIKNGPGVRLRYASSEEPRRETL